MTKNNQTNEDFEQQTTPAPKAKGTAGYKALILLLFLILIIGGGAAYQLHLQDMADMRQQIDSVKQATNTKIADLNNRLLMAEKSTQQFKDILYTSTSETDRKYDNKLADLKKELTQLIFGAQNAEPENVTEAPTEQATSEKTNQPQIVEKIITIEKEKTPQEVLLAAGSIIVKDMAENGLPIEYETEVLQILAAGNPQAQKYADTAQQYASSGIKGQQMLIKEYNALYAALNDVPEKPAEPQTQEPTPQNWQDKVLNWLKKVVIQKKRVKKPEFKAETDEVYELVNAGKLNEALAKMRTDAKYTSVNSAALTEWQNQVENYLAFENAMKGLIMNALANIRLKEMEH